MILTYAFTKLWTSDDDLGRDADQVTTLEKVILSQPLRIRNTNQVRRPSKKSSRNVILHHDSDLTCLLIKTSRAQQFEPLLSELRVWGSDIALAIDFPIVLSIAPSIALAIGLSIE